MAIFRTSNHGRLTVFAIKQYIAVIRGDRFYANPVLFGKIRRDKRMCKKATKIFCSLNWAFISGCHEVAFDDRLVVSCQGYTFELQLVENEILGF